MPILVRHSAVAGGGDSGTLIFADDFEGRSVGASVAGTNPPIRVAPARWGSVNTGTGSILVAGTGHGSSRGLAYFWPNGSHLTELRYILDDTGEHQYRELWMEQWIFIPANWRLPASAGEGDNNKFFFFYNDDTGASSYVDCEWYSYVPGAFNPNEFEGAYFMVQTKISGGEGQFQTSNLAGAISGNSHGESYPFIDYAVDRGTWIKFGVHVRKDSGAAIRDGVIEIYKNDSPIWRRTGLNLFDTGANSNGYSNNHISGGYCWGHANTGYDQDTTYIVDDFRIAVTRPGWGT